MLMNKILNWEDESPLEDDIEEAKENARDRLRLWKRRAAYSALAFFLSCASVVPFLEGHSLRAYWHLGKNLVLLSMGMLIPFVFCTTVVFGAYSCLRDLERGAK
jgi:hypothetical protein